MRSSFTRFTCILALLLMMSWGNSASADSEVRTFTLLPWMESDTGKNTTLSISMPSSWTMEQDETDMVSFRPPGVSEYAFLGVFNVNLFSCSDSEKGADCVQTWADRHFRDAAPGALQREEVGEDHLWITTSAGSDGTGVSARYYVFNAGKLAVVNFQLGGDTLNNLETFKKVGSTLAFASK